MNQYGKMVLWMGLILMALQIAFKWSEIRSIIFHGESSGGGLGILGPGIGLLPAPLSPARLLQQQQQSNLNRLPTGNPQGFPPVTVQ